MQNKSVKEVLKNLWDLRHLTTSDFLKNITSNPELKFILTGVGLWLFVRWTFSILIAAHLFSFIGRVFSMVLG
jgi:hypothetical protein